MTQENALTLEHVLNIRHIMKWAWSPKGDEIAALLDNGGMGELYVHSRDSSSKERVGESIDIRDFDWRPNARAIVVATRDALYDLKRSEQGWSADHLLISEADPPQVPRYSPDGNLLAFMGKGGVCILNPTNGKQVIPLLQRGQAAPDQDLLWSPCGNYLAFHFRDPLQSQQVGVCTREGRTIWRTNRRSAMVGALGWTDDGNLLHVYSSARNTVAEYATVHVKESIDRTAVRVIHIDRALGTPGALRATGAWPEPGGNRILFRLENDGWAHLYLLDDNEHLRQVTFGEGEDMGFVDDAPAWAPTGRFASYATNIDDPGERQLWLLDTKTSSSFPLTQMPGTNVSPKWCPDGSHTIGFVHCDARRSADVWVIDASQCMSSDARPIREGAQTTQVTHTLPADWTLDMSVVPEEIRYKGAKGLEITGYLLKPPMMTNESKDTYPALVWVHGGPVRQMRPGFHPSRSYALFHAYSQYLAYRGFVTLAINFRGGIGYGREFRNALYQAMGVDDVGDVVEAGRFLKSLPFVDASRVAVWGLSYGGYMTLTALTKYPEEFTMGINVAGVYDFVQWTHWIHELKGPWSGNFSVFFGGDPDDAPERYYQGSPANFIASLRRPLVNFHGTADKNVDFAQMDRIVKDCLRLGKEYEAHYYPDEVHTFARRDSWRDAFGRIEAAFDQYLR